MLNLGFELGHTDIIIGQTSTQPGRPAQQPVGWILSARPIGSPLRSAGVFPGDDPPIYEIVTTLPEVKVLPEDQLPADQRPGGPDPLILDGTHCFKVFSAYNPYSLTASLLLPSSETNAQPGDTVRITGHVNTHYHPYPGGDGSLGACRWRALAQGETTGGGTWHTYKLDVTDRQWFDFTAEAKAGEDGAVELSIDLESAAISGITYFVDAIRFEVIPTDPEPPDPGTCPGSYRIPYPATRFILPPREKITDTELADLMARIIPQARQNGWGFMFSADEAGGGDLPQIDVIALLYHEDDWDRLKLLEFYEEHYPIVSLTFREMYPVSRFPVAIDTYPPAAYYVAQGFSLGATGHPGIDINLDVSPWGDVDRGIPVIAMTSGEITYISDSWSGLGMIVVKHTIGGTDYWVRYAHLDVGSISLGDYVEAGHVLGAIGDYQQGAGGDHLHLEIHTAPVGSAYRTGNEISPLPWMKEILRLDPILVDAFARKGDTPDLPPDPPDPPDPGLPLPYVQRSGNVLGLHSGYQKRNWDTYWVQSRANAQKVFTLGFGIEARRIVPDPRAVIDWRKHSDDQVGIYDHPIKLLDRYSAEIQTHHDHTGMPISEILDAITCIESLNETIGTFSPDAIKRAVEFDVGFAELLHQRYGDALAPCLLNVAIGNPHESEVDLLIPAAKAADLYNGFVGYHAYWTANRDRNYLLEYWKIHAGRWMEWDRVFTAAGAYPRYLLSEGGIVYSPDGLNFNSGKGWKSCGSFEPYLAQMDKFVQMVKAWNVKNQNRAYALTIFCHGNNWENFELEDNVLLMRDRSPAWV